MKGNKYVRHKWTNGGGVNLPSKNKSFNRNLFKSFSIPFFIFSMFVSSNVFANKCENFLENEEKIKKELMDKYGKSWDEIVVLAKKLKLKNKKNGSRIDSMRVNTIEGCKENINYLDDLSKK